MRKKIFISFFALFACFAWAGAELVTTPWAGVNYNFNLCDGSIIAANSDVKTDVDYGIFRSYLGTGVPYQYNGAQHGVEFKAGNIIELDVARDATIRIGGCQYSGSTSTITVSDKNGSYTETVLSKTPTCNDTLDFVYTGPATTIKIDFGVGKTYVPSIDVVAGEVVPEAGLTYNYKFFDGSVLPQVTTTKYPMFVTADGILTMNSNTINTSLQFWYHDATHGVVMYPGTTMKFAVAGDATITFGTCQYSAANAVFNITDETGTALGTTIASDNGTGVDGSHSFVYKGDAGFVTATLSNTSSPTGAVYIHYATIENEKAKTSKIDSWDFGAAQLDALRYNNQLTESIINGWYPSTVTAGSTGAVLPTSFTAGVLSWTGGGNDRLRTSNTNLTRYDANSAPITIGDSVLTGSLYVNSSANISRYFTLSLSENDEVYLYVKSSASSILNFIYEDAAVQSDTANVSSAGRVVRFVAKNSGEYKIYDSSAKPFYYRVLRKDATMVNVSGAMNETAAADIPSGYSIVFTNHAGKSWNVPVTGSAYAGKVPSGFEYTLSLANANGYIISNGTSFTVKNDTVYEIAVTKLEMYTVSGSFFGLNTSQLSKLKLNYNPPASANKIFIPETIVDAANATYTAKLEPNCKYMITADGVNDFIIPVDSITIHKVDTTVNITFEAKPVYPVTITTEGLVDSLKTKLNVVFTNLNESGYVYSFADMNNINLRDGVYSISCTGVDDAPVELGATSNISINSGAGSKALAFKTVTFWPFDDVVISNGTAAYKGLLFTGNIYNEIAKSHLVAKSKASIEVPMNPGEKLTVTYYYAAKFSIAGGDTISTASGSTSTYESTSYLYPGSESGYVTIGTGAATTYITDIAVAKTLSYAAIITVGVDKDYQTVNDALSAVRSMIRPNKERVKIMVDPGNYEEMLVIDVDSVSIVNASSTPSIALVNMGVDIDANAVRITSYYGHGYNYYSMGSNQKWSADVLRVNKENGYTNYINTGGTSTSGSYWNATVVVSAPGFVAKNIIFENSYNQYISMKESDDVVEEWATGGKGTRPTVIGSTDVQAKSFVERAAAIAITNSGDKTVLDKCRVVGRQDSFYGAEGARVVAYKGSLMGGTDYIFGGMTLICYKSDLAMNTSETSTDVSYITAAQQSSSRGFLMYECTVTSAKPGTETASAYLSKPGLFGRPWLGTTSEVVFYNTMIDSTNSTGFEGKSLIQPEAWSSSLGGASDKCYEYGTVEQSGEDNSASRISWSHVLTTPVLTDAIDITTFNFTKGTDNWDPIPNLIVNDVINGVIKPQTVSSVKIYAYGNKLFVSNIKSNTKINIYGLDGLLIKTLETDVDTNITLQKGLCIVKAIAIDGNKVIKVLIQ